MDAQLSMAVIENLLAQIEDLKAGDSSKESILSGATYYSMPGIPNPRIVDYYASEVGVLDDLYSIQRVVDVMGNENRTSEELIKLNPDGAVPFLKLKDGTVVAETIAICQLIESSGIGSTKLFGESVTEKGVVNMWQRRVEQHICLPAFNFFRCGPAREMFKDRGMHGHLLPEMAASAKETVLKELKWLEGLVSGSGSDFICLNKISIADVQLYCVLQFILEFAALGAPPIPEALEGLPWLQAWYARMGARPAAAASVPSQ